MPLVCVCVDQWTVLDKPMTSNTHRAWKRVTFGPSRLGVDISFLLFDQKVSSWIIFLYLLHFCSRPNWRHTLLSESCRNLQHEDDKIIRAWFSTSGPHESEIFFCFVFILYIMKELWPGFLSNSFRISSVNGHAQIYLINKKHNQTLQVLSFYLKYDLICLSEAVF